MRSLGHADPARPVRGSVSNTTPRIQTLIAARNIGLLILCQILYNKRYREMQVLRLLIVGMIIYTALELWYNNIEKEEI